MDESDNIYNVFGRRSPNPFVAKCVRNRKDTASSLDGISIEAKDEENDVFVDKVLKRTGAMLPKCDMDFTCIP